MNNSWKKVTFHSYLMLLRDKVRTSQEAAPPDSSLPVSTRTAWQASEVCQRNWSDSWRKMGPSSVFQRSKGKQKRG